MSSMEKVVINRRFILVVGYDRSFNLRCGVRNVYGLNVDLEKRHLWDDLGKIIREGNIPWCIWGDYNIVKNGDENIRVSTNEKAMEQFSKFIKECRLTDLLMFGGDFTWMSNWKLRFDHFLISLEILEACHNIHKLCLSRSIWTITSLHWVRK